MMLKYEMGVWGEMSYFLIYATEDGLRAKQFRTNDEITKHLTNYFTDSPQDFLQFRSNPLNGEIFDSKQSSL